MAESDGLRGAVCELIGILGLDVLEKPQVFVGAVADVCDPDSDEATVLYAHCSEDLLRPYSRAVAEGTQKAMYEAARRAEYYLHEARRVTSTDAHIVAYGIAGGIVDYLRSQNPGWPVPPEEWARQVMKEARDILLGDTPSTVPEIKRVLANLQALPGDMIEAKMLAWNLAERLTQIQSGLVPDPKPHVRRRVCIDFSSNGAMGDVPAPIECSKGETVILPDSGALTKAGHRFAGWGPYPKASVGLKPGFKYNFTSNVTFYALWEPEVTPQPNIVTVSFDANGGAGAPPARSCPSGGSVVLPGPGALARAGYRFGGWGENPTSVIPKRIGLSYQVTHDVTLYAVWVPEKRPKDPEDVTQEQKAGGVRPLLLIVGLLLACAGVALMCSNSWDGRTDSYVAGLVLLLLGLAMTFLSASRKK